MRKWLKWIGIGLLIPLVLVIMTAVLLFIPPIQNFAVKQAMRYAGKATGMEIGIERIRLKPPMNLAVYGLEVITEAGDTLATLGELSVRINPWPLLDGVLAVDDLALRNITFNTGTFVEGMLIRGSARNLAVEARHVGLRDEKVMLNLARLSDADIYVCIDSLGTSEDDSTSVVNWIIDLQKIDLQNITFAMDMPMDTLSLSTRIDEASVRDGLIDLGLGSYRVNRFTLSASEVNYSGDENEPSAGLDPMHIGLRELTASIDSLFYHDTDIGAIINQFSLKERSGLQLSSFEGQIRMDSTTISIPELTLKTPTSSIGLFATIPWSSIDKTPEGKLQAMLNASIDKADIFTIVPDFPADFKKAFPEEPFTLTAGIEGNTNQLLIRQLFAELPGVMHLYASGKMGSLLDEVRRTADIQIEMEAQDLSFVLNYLPPEERSGYAIPTGIALVSDIKLAEQTVDATAKLTESDATIDLTGWYHLKQDAYRVSLLVDNLAPIRYMPNDSLMKVAMNLELEGHGFDLFAPTTSVELKGKVGEIEYGGLQLADLQLSASLKEHQANLEFKSENEAARLSVIYDGTIRRDQIDGMLIIDAEWIDLQALNVMEEPFTTTFQVFAEAKSNLKEANQVDVSLGNWEIRTAEQRFRPKLLTLKARTTVDTTQMSVNSGDFMLTLTGNASLNGMLEQFNKISAEVDRQLVRDSTVNIAALQPSLPDMSLTIRAGKDNPLYNTLQAYRMGFNRFTLDASTSPDDGLQLATEVFAAFQDTFLIDTIRMTVRPDSLGLRYRTDVVKNRYRQQQPFSAHVFGSVRNKYLDCVLLFRNHLKETGLLLGIKAEKEREGFNLKFIPEEPIIAFNKFKLNPDNYIIFRDKKNIEADVRFTGEENASLWLHSIAQEEGYPEVHLELSQINLQNLSDGLAELAPITGMLSADLQYAPTEETMMIVADAHIDELTYNNGCVGELMLNAVYLPLDGGQHQVDIHSYRDREEVVTATALYQQGKQDKIDGSLAVASLPLLMVNPFIPEGMAALNGALSGEMSVQGSTAKPMVNGFLQLDTGTVYIGMADARLKFDNKKIEVKNSKINFNRYHIYSAGNNPFVIDGNIDFTDLSQMMADLKLSANNMQLLDAARSRESLVYGKMFINLNTSVKGPLNMLDVRGNLRLLGGTNVTYVMTESSLTVQDRLKDLVTFTSFADTLIQQRRRQSAVPVGGVDMLLVINIDPVVQFRVDLAADQSSFVEIEGGGDLSFQYTKQGDMVLNGRYTFTGGNVNYALPIIPLKEFSIARDSYVQWDGEAMNPELSIKATERMRVSTKTAGESSPRMVNFDVGINIRNRLDDMDMEFLISAPEDMAIQNELASMGADERSKQAIAMMITGTYMYGGGSGGMNLDVNSALTNFLTGEINNIAGDALKGVDISFGMETYDEEEGSARRDFSFRFAKRFYNDRIQVVVGGKVSTGGEAQQTEPFLDNVSVEYRLDPAGSKNVKLFYDRNYESLLEGEIIETGAGIIFRKKMLNLKELFNFRKTKVTPEPEDEDKEVEIEKSEENEKEAGKDEGTGIK